MNECFYAKCKISLRFAAAWETLFWWIRYWFTSNHIPFRFSCRPREASRLEAKTHEAEATTHEAEAKAEATTHEAEAKAEARFFDLEAEARPRGLTSLLLITYSRRTGKHRSMAYFPMYFLRLRANPDVPGVLLRFFAGWLTI